MVVERVRVGGWMSERKRSWWWFDVESSANGCRRRAFPKDPRVVSNRQYFSASIASPKNPISMKIGSSKIIHPSEQTNTPDHPFGRPSMHLHRLSSSSSSSSSSRAHRTSQPDPSPKTNRTIIGIVYEKMGTKDEG